MRRVIPDSFPTARAAALAWLGVVLVAGADAAHAAPESMSIGNRILFDRALIDGRNTIQVMLALEAAQHDRIAAYVRELGGRVRTSERAIAYMRVEIPVAQFVKLVGTRGIDAYQIASDARAAWYRDTQSAASVSGFRNDEVPDWSGGDSAGDRKELAVLTPQQATAPGYTGESAIGLEEFRARHPTYDGRGVTIALVESGRILWDHLTFSSATALDGSRIDKVAGVISAVDADDGDSTRVEMKELPSLSGTWARYNNSTYTLPAPGQYRLGIFEVRLSRSTVQQFAVLLEEGSSRVWVDTNSDASFVDERPLKDVNERFDFQHLRIDQPNLAPVPFVVTVAANRSAVHIYMPAGHNTMTASVAAGAAHDSTWVSGFAPAARLMLVNHAAPTSRLASYIEGVLAAAKHPDVDVISDSFGIMYPDAHTQDAFIWLLLGRISKVYRKLILHAAHNYGPPLGSSSGAGPALSIGGFVSPETYRALVGPELISGPARGGKSPYGPTADGGMAPHLLVPMYRLSLYNAQTRAHAIPAYRPEIALPQGHFFSCCTSSASPIAVGLVARLISGAKQRGIDYSPERLSDALLSTARHLEGAPVYAQGAGTIDLERSWQALERQAELPIIHFRAPVKHALAKYAPRPGVGVGLLEVEGWQPGQSGERRITIHRESGPPTSVAYAVRWTGNDGTYSSASRVDLPFAQEVSFPIRIDVRTAGAHSARLELVDLASGFVSARMLATVVAPEALDARNRYRRIFQDQVSPMQAREHFVEVAPGTALLRVEFALESGVARFDLLPPTRMPFYKYPHLLPWAGDLSPGNYTLLVPNPTPGLWSFSVENDPFAYAADRSGEPPQMARYQLTLSAASASIALAASSEVDGAVVLRLSNQGVDLSAATVRTAAATASATTASYEASGLSRVFTLDVPPGTSMLRLLAKAHTGASDLEMHLYDCTSGQCFSHEFALPAAGQQSIVVRSPTPGRWRALVNAAPYAVGSGQFSFEDLMVHSPMDTHAASARQSGEQWTLLLPAIKRASIVGGRRSAIYVEVIDEELSREEHQFGLVRSQSISKLSNRPAALAVFVQPMD